MTTADPTTPGLCVACADGNHSAHSRALAGVCPGCPCPWRPDGPETPPETPHAAADGPTAPIVDGWTVGKPGAVYVGLVGTVTALDAGTVTIDGIAVPRVLTGPIRYLADTPPREYVELDEVCPSCETSGDDAERVQRRWQETARRAHDDDTHPGAFPLCGHPVCRLAREPW